MLTSCANSCSITGGPATNICSQITSILAKTSLTANSAKAFITSVTRALMMTNSLSPTSESYRNSKIFPQLLMVRLARKLCVSKFKKLTRHTTFRTSCLSMPIFSVKRSFAIGIGEFKLRKLRTLSFNYSIPCKIYFSRYRAYRSVAGCRLRW